MVTSVQNSQQISLSIGLPEEASKAIANGKNLLNETTHNTINSVGGKLQQLEQLSNTISIEIERTINSLINHKLVKIQHWVDAHPAISWLLKFITWSINHPAFGLVIFLLVIFIIWQLFKVCGRLVEKGLLVALTAPIKLITKLLKFSFKPLSFLGGNSKNVFLFNSQDQQDKLRKLLNRLEAIKQEQNDILQEITAIVSAKK